ncbi:MAG: type II secretion system protein [Bacteroidales bacterium]
MAVLLVGLAIMTVMLSVAMPVWHQAMQREKEEELIFRGMQYARAIGLYQRKFPGAFPPSLDTLVEQKFLRKKYKDPMVPDGEFQLVPAGATGQAGMVSGLQQVNPQSRTSTGSSATSFGSTSAFGSSTSTGRSGSPGSGLGSSSSNLGTYVGPFSGVVSKSKDKSIKIYNGKDHYNEWLFVWASSAAMGGGRGMRGPGGRGQGTGPGTQMPPGGGRGRGGRGMGPGGGATFDQFQPPPGPGRGRGQ